MKYRVDNTIVYQKGGFVTPFTNKYVYKFMQFLDKNLRKGPPQQKAMGPLIMAHNKPTIIGKDGFKV